MTHEQHLALDLIARLANRFGPASRIAKELPGWLEYLTGHARPNWRIFWQRTSTQARCRTPRRWRPGWFRGAWRYPRM
jgi:hypothetical protein